MMNIIMIQTPFTLCFSLCLSEHLLWLPTNTGPWFDYLQSEMGLVTATGRWIRGKQILQSSVSSPSVWSILKTRPRWADDQTDLWRGLCKPFTPCEPENQRQDFRMALGQRLVSLCYLIANFHKLLSLICCSSSFVFSDIDCILHVIWSQHILEE